MNSSAGKGTPYWYEWTVGLLRVVEMLYSESGISSVSFQEAGIKGWDDVVVRYSDGRTEYIQIKHSREGTNITFGSFLTFDEDGVCLLESLYGAWRKMGLSSKTATCLVFTNREAGERTYLGRPPLLEFTAWLRDEAGKRNSLAEVVAPNEWKGAWDEWIARLNIGTDDERLDFLRALKVETNQPDLEQLQTVLLQRLAEAFGASVANAVPLLHAFNDALKKWTDRHEHVTAEDAFAVLVLPADLDTCQPAPPPPAPFFPTRDKDAHEIESALAKHDGPPVLFLSATPGAGKTSVISRIESRRTEKVLSGIVSLRYFAFRPITPEAPLIPADADFYVRPERLWYSLLSQLRHELGGKLWTYRVPVRNSLLTWQNARSHVLRLADRIGTELGRRFVIVVDGIDHAARAGRSRLDPEMARDFFNSLPSPEELRGKQIRLLVAGQPAENYPEYPAWLRAPGSEVQKLNLGPLEAGDIAALIQSASLQIPSAEWDEAVKIIAEAAQGNTLAIVFAVEEAKTCVGAAELRTRLQERALREGLQAYYEAIWRYAFTGLPKTGSTEIGLEAALAGSLSLLRERASGSLLAKALPTLGLTGDQWHLVLANLGPLIVSEESGFRVLHNDVRVFLARHLAGRPDAEKTWIYSALANYYLRPTSDRFVAHTSLLSLLRGCGRDLEWARIFTVDWVFEAAALGVRFDEVWPQCEIALRSGAELRDWNVMHELACANETLERWFDRAQTNHEPKPGDRLPPFFPPSELVVLPFGKWSIDDLRQVAEDVDKIIDAHELPRALALLGRWFAGLTLSKLGERFFQETDEENGTNPPHGKSPSDVFAWLGAVCRQTAYDFERGEVSDNRHKKAHFHFEQGWIERSCVVGPFNSLAACFEGRLPRFFNGCALAIRRLATVGHWRLAGRLLRIGHDNRSKFPQNFQFLAAWWCLRSGTEKRCPGWLDSLKTSQVKFSTDYLDNLEVPLAVCRARGWLEPTTHPSTIARQVFDKSERTDRSERSMPRFLLLFRAAAVLGRFAALESKGKLDAVRDLFRPSEIGELASALWDGELAQDMDFHRHLSVAGQLAVELVRAFFPISTAHADALIQVGRPIAERWWGDHRFDSLWELFRLAGDRELLRKWIYSILGPTSWLWEEGADSRESTAEEYLPLARELGEEALADQVQKRLRWLRISYRGHKDYSFRWPTVWFGELSLADPTSIRTLGFRLLSLCEACSAQGGDNRWWSDVNTAVGAAAIASGPDDVYRLLFAGQPSCGTYKWLDQTVARFVNGLADVLSRNPAMTGDEKIVCWCIAVGMTRWFDNGDVFCIADLRRTLLQSCNSDEERTAVRKTLEEITPGEAVREPVRDDRPKGESDANSKDLSKWREELEAGRRLLPAEALYAIQELLRTPSAENQKLINRVLESFGTSNSLSGGWGSYYETKTALVEIARSVPDASLWFLVKAAISPAGNVGYWWSPVQENLQSVILARSFVRGPTELRSGLTRILDMHERWARGGDLSLPLPLISPASGAAVNTWPELATEFLAMLLSSRFATVIEAGLVGLQALVSRHPEMIGLMFNRAEGDNWKTQWLLNAAEVWAIRYSSQLKAAKQQIEKVLENGPLGLRLQAWIVLSLLADRDGEAKPRFPSINPADETTTPRLSRPLREILHTTADSKGAFRLVDRHEASRSTIKRVEMTTGIDFSEVTDRVSPRLLNEPEFEHDQRPWSQRIRGDTDSFCCGEHSHSILDTEFDRSLAAVGLPESQVPRFAQGYLSNEDPWMLRQTPQPDPNLSAWPSEDFLAGKYDQPPSSQSVRELLRSVACETGIPADEVVVAAKLQAFCWREDFMYWSWWEEAASNAKGQQPAMPTTLSSRTFPVMLCTDWWEPKQAKGRRAVSFATGGQQHLLHSFPEVSPARLWITTFGWNPAPDSPFVWMTNGKPVARLEVLHGPIREMRSNPARQPILHRWVAKRDAWQVAFSRLTDLQWREDFQRAPSEVEH